MIIFEAKKYRSIKKNLWNNFPSSLQSSVSPKWEKYLQNNSLLRNYRFLSLLILNCKYKQINNTVLQEIFHVSEYQTSKDLLEYESRTS